MNTEYVLLPEAKPRTIILMRSSPEGYSGVAEGNIFSIGQLPLALFILLHGHLTCTYKTNYFLISHIVVPRVIGLNILPRS